MFSIQLPFIELLSKTSLESFIVKSGGIIGSSVIKYKFICCAMYISMPCLTSSAGGLLGHYKGEFIFEKIFVERYISFFLLLSFSSLEHRRCLTTWLVFLSRRETTSQPGIEPPTTPFGLGTSPLRATSHRSQEPRPCNGEDPWLSSKGCIMGVGKVVLCSHGPSSKV